MVERGQEKEEPWRAVSWSTVPSSSSSVCVRLCLFCSWSVVLLENMYESSNNSNSCSHMGGIWLPSSDRSSQPWTKSSLWLPPSKGEGCWKGDAFPVLLWWHHLQRSLVTEKLSETFLLSCGWMCSHNLRHLAIDCFSWFPFLITMFRNKSTLTRIKGSERRVLFLYGNAEKKKSVF